MDILEMTGVRDDSTAENIGSVTPKEIVRGIVIDRSRDAKMTDFGKKMMQKDYLLPGESFQDRFAIVARTYADDDAHAQRLYDYFSRHWMMPATPVLSNGGAGRGLPISCFLNECDDSLRSIKSLWAENIELASNGGGIGSYWGNLRSIGERVGLVGQTSGIVPFVKVQDSLTLAISQGSLRRGSGAAYLDIWHPEIEEFIEIRRSTGGDPNRKTPNLHHGVVVSDAFMEAVERDGDWDLKSPKTGHVIRTVKARDLWVRLITARIETGEPYILFKDAVNRAIPEHHKRSGLFVKTSNLCAEITLPTGLDHLGNVRTAVCCLSSLNLEYFEEWSKHPGFVEDALRFLDNVLSDFIARAPSEVKRAEQQVIEPLLEDLRNSLSEDVLSEVEAALRKSVSKHFRGLMDNAIYAAERERSVGLGVMGFHTFLQSKRVPYGSAMAKSWNMRIFKFIKEQADLASRKLAFERGPCPDAAEHGIMERFSNKTAIAPTASISIICGQASPGIETIAANAYTEKRKIGTFSVRNKYLKPVLESYGRDDDDTWRSIVVNKGSVQHLDFMSDYDKEVFKTSYEIDQMWTIEHAADRTPYVDQSQSVNIYLPGDVSKKILNKIHREAWKKGLKSLYYCRSLSIDRSQVVSAGTTQMADKNPGKPVAESNNGEECLACQ